MFVCTLSKCFGKRPEWLDRCMCNCKKMKSFPTGMCHPILLTPAYESSSGSLSFVTFRDVSGFNFSLCSGCVKAHSALVSMAIDSSISLGNQTSSPHAKRFSICMIYMYILPETLNHLLDNWKDRIWCDCYTNSCHNVSLMKNDKQKKPCACWAEMQ